jgi:hypothetical protein
MRMFTQNRPLASKACQARDCLVGQNSTSGGSRDRGGEGLTGEPDRDVLVRGRDDGDAGAELPEHISECAWVDRRAGRHGYLKPTLKS